MNELEPKCTKSDDAANGFKSGFSVDEAQTQGVGSPNTKTYEARLEEDFESDPRLFATRLAEEAAGFNTNQEV